MMVAFVILHYLTTEDTVSCIRSILESQRHSSIQHQLIVVDNGSPNQSYTVLESELSGKPNVHLLRLEHNEGFARGNNAGFQFAKHRLHADFIVLLNNDTILDQSDFLFKLDARFREHSFDILAPDIVTPFGVHQNPKSIRGVTPEKIRQKIHQVRTDIWLVQTGLYNLLIAINRIKYAHRSHFISNREEAPSIESPAGTIVPHGSCLIFSPRYVQRFNGLYSGTFLYCEEEILWLFAEQEKLVVDFFPAIQICHLEDRATSAVAKPGRKKRLFKLKHELDSLLLLSLLFDHPEILKTDLYDTKSSEGD
jgi:GT2 family glycosyltransferase